MNAIRLFFCALVFFSLSTYAYEGDYYFSPTSGVKAKISTKGQTVKWKVYFTRGSKEGHFDIDTEKSIHVDVNDYDFSGRRGFAVWHVDDGMGVYSVYRVFTFSPSTNQFIERNPVPQCGGEFNNLRVDEKGHRLFSTFWDQGIPKTCVTRLRAIR
jgi:hypothetical protein